MASLVDLGAQETVLHGHLPLLVAALEWIAAGIDLCAIALLVLGALRFILSVAPSELVPAGERRAAMNEARLQLGVYILAGLELFIVSDVIHTALSLAIGDLLFLLLLVVIRAIISFFLDRELAQIAREKHG
ncbi:DUF1622 domain-containing protein [Pseudoponticoccus marisrubri]|uniref:DUF1622 domain-containing protein n=1 Tax=Pseudoponticoccus marisrubri TaxID=1685382 RepID=A0A0W7WEX6_9RHOB|nr:DUF1622 domain-containing protein [Pseudoponticoccus marisrubri]KUF09106.1 hypothetical protein AVJ23_19475 [Pseudoponticoccus marisrubri]